MDLANGKFQITINEHVISTILFESFNPEGISLWITAMKEAINSFQGKPFSLLVNELEATGATPDALALANSYNHWLNEQNLIAKAVIYSANIYKEIDKKALPSRKHQNIAFFNDPEQAAAWLEAQWHLHIRSQQRA